MNSDGEIQISYDIVYMWNLKKNGTNELFFYKTEIETQMWKISYGGEGRREKLGD